MSLNVRRRITRRGQASPGFTPRKRHPKLSAEEQRLIDHPPTEATWYCAHREQYEASDGEMRERVTHVTNAGGNDHCWLCRERKPAKPKLAWPVYQAALAKVAPPDTPKEGAE